MNSSTTGKWISRPRPNPRARLRLFCIAHAGGGASAFRGWADALPPEVEVCLVQLPGRENRLMEKPFDRLDPLVAALTDAVRPWLDLPWALFGHSNGALIGFELARLLRERGLPGPRHLFASGRRAPDVPPQSRLTGHLPDDEFLADLGELGGLPRELLENREIMQMLLPLLRGTWPCTRPTSSAKKRRWTVPSRRTEASPTPRPPVRSSRPGRATPVDRSCFACSRAATSSTSPSARSFFAYSRRTCTPFSTRCNKARCAMAAPGGPLRALAPATRVRSDARSPNRCR